MASTSGSVPYPTSTSTTDDLASGSASTRSNGTTTGATGAATPPVVERVAESAHRVVDQLAGKAGPAVERLRGSMSDARESVNQHMADFSQTREEWAESARESVRRNPLAAIGIAAAVGYVLARLTSDR